MSFFLWVTTSLGGIIWERRSSRGGEKNIPGTPTSATGGHIWARSVAPVSNPAPAKSHGSSFKNAHFTKFRCNSAATVATEWTLTVLTLNPRNTGQVDTTLSLPGDYRCSPVVRSNASASTLRSSSRIFESYEARTPRGLFCAHADRCVNLGNWVTSKGPH